MAKKTDKLAIFKEHKIMTLYCIILFVLIFFIVGSVYSTTSTGVTAYYQYVLFSVFCLLLGLPIFLFATIFLTCSIYRLIKDFPTFFMKRKRKMTKIGKKKLKDGMFMLGLLIFVTAIGFTFTFLGFQFGWNSIADYSYLDQPKELTLYVSGVERSHNRTFQSTYRLVGVGDDGKNYSFRIGKYPNKVLSENGAESVLVRFLPNSEIVMEVK